MKIYKIANWVEKYETADTRKRKTLFWVLVPNSHDGLGFCSIMERDDALEVFGAWVLILQVASKCSTRGSLTTTKGRPYTAKDIATMTRAPVDSITDALDVLVEIGWITADVSGAHPDTSADHPDTSADHPDTSADDPDVSADDPDVSAGLGKSLSVKKERERRKKKEPPLPPTGGSEGGESGIEIPSPLAGDAVFVSSWESWCRYQEQSGNRRWGPEMIKQQLEHLATMTPGDAATSLCDAMLKGWQGPARVNHGPKGKGGEPAKPARVKVDTTTADEAIRAMKEATT